MTFKRSQNEQYKITKYPLARLAMFMWLPLVLFFVISRSFIALSILYKVCTSILFNIRLRFNFKRRLNSAYPTSTLGINEKKRVLHRKKFKKISPRHFNNHMEGNTPSLFIISRTSAPLSLLSQTTSIISFSTFFI